MQSSMMYADSDDALMSATSDVTEGLRRTMQLMQQELDRSVLSNQMLGALSCTSGLAIVAS